MQHVTICQPSLKKILQFNYEKKKDSLKMQFSVMLPIPDASPFSRLGRSLTRTKNKSDVRLDDALFFMWRDVSFIHKFMRIMFAILLYFSHHISFFVKACRICRAFYFIRLKGRAPQNAVNRIIEIKLFPVIKMIVFYRSYKISLLKCPLVSVSGLKTALSTSPFNLLKAL